MNQIHFEIEEKIFSLRELWKKELCISFKSKPFSSVYEEQLSLFLFRMYSQNTLNGSK